MNADSDDLLALYRQRGLGSAVGFGRRPAVLVIDFIRGFTDPQSPLGADLKAEVTATARLLAAARGHELPVLFTTTAYGPGLRDAGLFPKKIPSLEILLRGSRWVEVDERLERRPEETLIEKKYASAFFGTALAAELTAAGVDTLLVCGATTSGCVRATVVDALQHGFRPIVPVECVGDRAPQPHAANLRDIEGKYGDLVSVEEAITALDRLVAGGGS
ncbi:MAG: isochorismatase family protein [Acidobacteriota bacterium]